MRFQEGEFASFSVYLPSILIFYSNAAIQILIMSGCSIFKNSIMIFDLLFHRTLLPGLKAYRSYGKAWWVTSKTT